MAKCQLTTRNIGESAPKKRASKLNSAAPYGDHPRLRSVELAARGLDRLMQPDISIPQELRLPNLRGSRGQLFA